YAEMVRDAGRQRRLIDGTRMDWVVVRNRLSMLGSRNKRLVGEGLSELATRLSFRCADGLAERVVYRELFPRGLSALDNLDQATGARAQDTRNLFSRLLIPDSRLLIPGTALRRRLVMATLWAANRQPIDASAPWQMIARTDLRRQRTGPLRRRRASAAARRR